MCGAVAAALSICVSKTISMEGMRRKEASHRGMKGEDRPGGRHFFVEDGAWKLIVAKIVRLGGYRERSAGRVSVMGRNALDALGQQITGCRMADVTQTDDADHPLALVDHRQPA